MSYSTYLKNEYNSAESVYDFQHLCFINNLFKEKAIKGKYQTQFVHQNFQFYLIKQSGKLSHLRFSLFEQPITAE